MKIAEQYFNEFGISQKPMAASVEALKYCQKVVESSSIGSILDSGSGLSSAFFHANFNNVTTIDDNAFWAEKTKAFVAQALGKEISINSIKSVEGQNFDFVFYDYGNMETRIFFFRQTLDMCKKMIYIDDMHVSYYREYIRSKFSNYFIRTLPETADEFGRYGALLVKKA